MKIAIVGGRDFNDYEKLKNALTPYLARCDVEICGEAKGADTLGAKWAQENYIKVEYFPADWGNYGRRAGYLRNEEMAKAADFVVAFWNGESKGTKHMIDLTLKYKKSILTIMYEKK